MNSSFCCDQSSVISKHYTNSFKMGATPETEIFQQVWERVRWYNMSITSEIWCLPNLKYEYGLKKSLWGMKWSLFFNILVNPLHSLNIDVNKHFKRFSLDKIQYGHVFRHRRHRLLHIFVSRGGGGLAAYRIVFCPLQ